MKTIFLAAMVAAVGCLLGQLALSAATVVPGGESFFRHLSFVVWAALAFWVIVALLAKSSRVTAPRPWISRTVVSLAALNVFAVFALCIG